MQFNMPKTTIPEGMQGNLKTGHWFNDVDWMEIEMTSSGLFMLMVHRGDDDLASGASAMRENKTGGWHTFHFHAGGEFNNTLDHGKYMISILNMTGGALEIRGGTLYYGG